MEKHYIVLNFKDVIINSHDYLIKRPYNQEKLDNLHLKVCEKL